MKRTFAFAALALTWMAVDCSAAPPEGTRGKEAAEAGQRVGPGQRGESGQRGAAGRRGNTAQNGQPRFGDPAQMVARMMQEFDKDGDQKLDTKELTALLTSLRERRAGGMAMGAGAARGERPGQANGDGATKMRQRMNREGMRKPSGETENAPGGQKPKRPTAQ